ncbi:hypothetical protein F4677DRAFT_451188 [Hypoxylon crocopeplum]|nr:hypothetical protein F4677DRAFT_451188 [Hypoxylon crocopeplum]
MPRPRRGEKLPTRAGDAEEEDLSDNDHVTLQDNVNSRGDAAATLEEPANTAQATNSESRKRRRLRQDDSQNKSSASTSIPSSNLSSAACDQCRIRKVRCDRQQPECSGCRKAGIARNDFSSVLYRLDEIDETLLKLTKQFAERSHPLAGSGSNTSRERVNRQLGPFPFSSNTPSSQSKSPGPSSTLPDLVLPSSQHELGQARLQMLGDLRPSIEDPFLTEKVELEHGAQRIYKYPASMALLKSISTRLARSCQVADIDINGNRASYPTSASTQAIIFRQLERFPFQGKCLQPVISSDHQPVVAPPRLITRLFIDGFLRNINTRIPIFNEKELRDAVDIYYLGLSQVASLSSTSQSALLADEHATDSPWAIIFTNTALLELGLEAQTARWKGSQASSCSITSSLLTKDLIALFFRNCDRALADLTPYTRPSLLHVQALLTLALVAREFYSNTVSEKVLQAACHVGRMLGLHLSKADDRKLGENPSERERVFQVLYSMDKQRVFLTGDPCDLYHFDSDLELCTSKSDEVKSPCRRLVAAIDGMMIIWEEVYLKLYSARAIAAGAEYLSSQVAGLMQLLTKWHEYHPGVLETNASGSSFTENLVGSNIHHSLEVDDLISLQLEVRYCYHVTHVLVLRCERSRDERAQVQMRHHARTCLQLIMEMGNIEGGPLPSPTHVIKARLASLGRVLGTYPIVAFTDLAAFHLDEILTNRPPPNSNSARGESDDVEADIKLLSAVPRLLQRLQHADCPTTYLNRLQAGLEWAVQVVEQTRRARLMEEQTGELSVIVPSDLAVGSIAASADANASTITGSQLDSSDIFTSYPMDLGDGNPGGMSDPIQGQSTAPFLGEMEAGEEAQQTVRTTAGGCGFFGLDNWQDFFT